MTMDDSYWQSLLRDVENETGPCREGANGRGPANSAEDRQDALDGWLPPADPDGHALGEESDWTRAEDLLSSGGPIDVTISGYNRGGLLAYFGRIPAFLPASHLVSPITAQLQQARMTALAARVGETLQVKVIEIDRERRRLILSERCVEGGGEVDSLLAGLQPGQVCHGKVTNLCAFGAFVDLGGYEGLIHISEMSWGRVSVPGEVVKPGDEVDVMVLEVNTKAQKVALSLKRLRPDPWQGLEERYHAGQIVDALITNVVSFGAFARLEEGLEGLIHISELAEGSFMHPRNVVNEGDKVRVRVLHVDGSKHRLALTMRCADAALRTPKPELTSDPQWPA
jgi:small subunit ribosomal protein S1